MSTTRKLGEEEKIIRGKVQHMRKGKVFKSYKDMCEYFGVKVKNGTSKKTQMKIIENFLELERKGNKFIVLKVNKNPPSYVDGRRKGNNKKYNSYDLSGDYGVRYTESGEEFWFDKEDFELISPYYWNYNANHYVQAATTIFEESRKHETSILLHRLVIGVENPSLVVDHIVHPTSNKNKYDNRKSNLRVVTRAQNRYNCHPHKSNKSGYSGVNYNELTGKWYATIGYQLKSISLGSYKTKEEAIAARKVAQKILYGEYDFDANNLSRFEILS